MSLLPPHTLPEYSKKSCEDALFHYTTASGLLGILNKKEIWSTAFYCVNDESELSTAKDVLTKYFRSKTYELIQNADPRVDVFSNSGVDIRHYADEFENRIISYALHSLNVYITCFCKSSNREDFLHGLLSQWRGYGLDGGYAVQFSRSKLLDQVKQFPEAEEFYDFNDVYYSTENPLKEEVIKHADDFVNAYLNFLDNLQNSDSNIDPISGPIVKLLGGPLEKLLDFRIYTKSGHFSEEKECRMSNIQHLDKGAGLPVDYFNRGGSIVPYIKTPQKFKLLDCIDWIIVGPSPRISDRFNSVNQMVRKKGLKIKVRPSGIPFSRF